VYNKDTVGYSFEQKWFNLFVDIQTQQDAPAQDKNPDEVYIAFPQSPRVNVGTVL
jgi:hypothetical protein